MVETEARLGASPGLTRITERRSESFNDWAGAGHARPPLPRILAFQETLLRHGITATVRWSKGEDIGAACGQLKEPVPA